MHKRRGADPVMYRGSIQEMHSKGTCGADMVVCVFHQSDLGIETTDSIQAFPTNNGSTAHEKSHVEQHSPDECESRTKSSTFCRLSGRVGKVTPLMIQLDSGPTPKGSMRPKTSPTLDRCSNT